jgi:hypothetical protein
MSKSSAKQSPILMLSWTIYVNGKRLDFITYENYASNFKSNGS